MGLTPIRDALANFIIDSGASDEYCKGVIVGATASLMTFRGIPGQQAVEEIAALMPKSCRILSERNVPSSWLDTVVHGMCPPSVENSR